MEEKEIKKEETKQEEIHPEETKDDLPVEEKEE